MTALDSHANPELAVFIRRLPKAELHVHIEGTLEPELIFNFARRNQITLAYESVEDLRNAYAFTNLQSFLDIYYAGMAVLQTQQDYREMTWAYLQRAHADGVVHAEIMVDGQAHTHRDIPLSTVFAGMAEAMHQARDELGLSSYLILSFLRDFPEDDALDTLEEALALRVQYQDLWVGVGLSSAELGNPPEKFTRLYDYARSLGFRCVAHAGEEGPAEYIRGALDDLKVERIDHGVACEHDPTLLERIIREQIPLTMCPLSNLRLGVVDNLSQHNAAKLLRQGACVTINSDDPSYFGGYIVDNYLAAAQALQLSKAELVEIAKNSLSGSFLSLHARQALLERHPFPVI